MNKYAVYTTRILGDVEHLVLLRYQKIAYKTKCTIIDKNYTNYDDLEVGSELIIHSDDFQKNNLYLVRDIIRFKATDDDAAKLIFELGEYK